MLVWMDLEMTGLDPTSDVIVEIATIVTDDELQVVAEAPPLVIHASDAQLAAMVPVVTEMHASSGLTDAIRASTTTIEEASAVTLAFLALHVPKGEVPLCGNSIGTDRRFLQAYLPEVESWFHYRNVDVSTLKELLRRWRPEVLAAAPDKPSNHRALDDVRASIEELRHYRAAIFTAPGPGALVTVLGIAEATAQLTAAGQMFEMEPVEVRGVEVRTWKHAPATLRTVFDLSKGHGGADFVVYEDERMTFEQHHARASAMATRLVELGVERGDRVAIAMRNLPEWVVAFWATIVAGAVAVPLNAWWTGDELAYGVADSGARVVFCDLERYERLSTRFSGLEFLGDVVVLDELGKGRSPEAPTGTAVRTHVFGELLGEVDGAVAPEREVDPDDDATIFYTSGTTGRPKGAVGTHRNACTNLMNLFFIAMRGQLRYADANPAATGVQNSFLLSVPLFHATGCLASMIVNAASGGKLVMMHHFDAERALELIERERVTTFGGVPTMALQILDSPAFATTDTSSVRSVSYGGAPAPPELVRRIKAAFPDGQPGNGYGLTETSAATSMNTGPDYVARPDSVGPAVPVTDVAIVPEEFEGTEPPDDRPTGPSVTGELWVRGPQVVRGYWNRPEETALVFTNGWLHTGDVARIDEDGFLYIVDRAKDVIIRGGENVYSVEVEAAIFEHPDVADCAVIGVPHPTYGEEVGAVVVPREGRSIDVDELREHVAARIARYNVPTQVWLWDRHLPRNPAGKVLKRQLRDEVVGLAAAAN